LKWLEKYPPLTGQGKLEKALALKSLKQLDNIEMIVKDIWQNHSLARSSEKTLLQHFSKYLSQSDHVKRLDMLLWSNQRSSARHLMNKVPNAEKRLAEARLGLIERQRGVDSLIKAVPASHQTHPGLLYERAKWRRQRLRNNEGALELLLKIKATNATGPGGDKLWKERRIHLRRLIKENRWDEAYSLISNHGLTRGTGFAEAEFYSGWIQLRYKNAPETALTHFETLANGVSSPISLARGLYWQGEALSALNKSDEAIKCYKKAAQHIHVFYGQMAAERLKQTGLDPLQMEFVLPQAPTPEEIAIFDAIPTVKAAKLMAETGRLNSFEQFSFHIDDQLTTPQEHQLLSDLAWSYLKPRAGIRGGKAALAKGIVVPDVAFPVPDLPQSPSGGAAEPALVMALSRQESELNPMAISHANARGMMQLLPATGRVTARKVGLPYKTSWLVDDPEYNMKLGRSYLDGLVTQFDGSYILALAAYNAGPSRPKKWVIDYGDPRKDEIDPVDFVESIPFSETRNYVMRILENTQVYRHRLSGSAQTIDLWNDLSRGSYN
jgi:soluble lytic murein transglycosylase